MKNILKPRAIALGLGLMLTTLCYGQLPYTSTAGPPHNVIYWDGYTGDGSLQSLLSSAYTDVIVSFITPDQNCNLSNNSLGAGPNGGLPSDIQSSIQQLHTAGKTVLVSFGGQEQYDSSGNDITSNAYQACYFGTDFGTGGIGYLYSQIYDIVNNSGFDGVDIDFEDNSGFTGNYDGVDFLTQLTNDLYSGLPTWQNIVTHAPQSPYWTSSFNWAYQTIYYNTRPAIAWFNVQFYNECPTDCTAQEKIADYNNIVTQVGVPPQQVVMGVAVSTNAAASGYIPLSSQDGNNVQTVISTLQQTYPNQFGGVMGWDYSWDLSDQGGGWGSGISGALTSNQPNWVAFNGQTGLCLDSNYNAFNNNVYTDSCNTGNYQNWQFNGNTIVDVQTGFCLDSDIHGNVYTDSCNTGNYQNWEFWGNIIFNRQTRLCLDSSNYAPSNGNVYTRPCNEGGSQTWVPEQ